MDMCVDVGQGGRDKDATHWESSDQQNLSCFSVSAANSTRASSAGDCLRAASLYRCRDFFGRARASDKLTLYEFRKSATLSAPRRRFARIDPTPNTTPWFAQHDCPRSPQSFHRGARFNRPRPAEISRMLVCDRNRNAAVTQAKDVRPSRQ
jgi:hypothetical protein